MKSYFFGCCVGVLCEVNEEELFSFPRFSWLWGVVENTLASQLHFNDAVLLANYNLNENGKQIYILKYSDYYRIMIVVFITRNKIELTSLIKISCQRKTTER